MFSKSTLTHLIVSRRFIGLLAGVRFRGDTSEDPAGDVTTTMRCGAKVAADRHGAEAPPRRGCSDGKRLRAGGHGGPEGTDVEGSASSGEARQLGQVEVTVAEEGK